MIEIEGVTLTDVVGVFVGAVEGEIAVVVVRGRDGRTAERTADNQIVPGIVEVVIAIAVIANLQPRELGLFASRSFLGGLLRHYYRAAA